MSKRIRCRVTKNLLQYNCLILYKETRSGVNVESGRPQKCKRVKKGPSRVSYNVYTSTYSKVTDGHFDFRRTLLRSWVRGSGTGDGTGVIVDSRPEWVRSRSRWWSTTKGNDVTVTTTTTRSGDSSGPGRSWLRSSQSRIRYFFLCFY